MPYRSYGDADCLDWVQRTPVVDVINTFAFLAVHQNNIFVRVSFFDQLEVLRRSSESSPIEVKSVAISFIVEDWLHICKRSLLILVLRIIKNELECPRNFC